MEHANTIAVADLAERIRLGDGRLAKQVRGWFFDTFGVEVMPGREAAQLDHLVDHASSVLVRDEHWTTYVQEMLAEVGEASMLPVIARNVRWKRVAVEMRDGWVSGRLDGQVYWIERMSAAQAAG